MSDLDLGIDFKINSPEAVAETEKVRKSVKAVGDTAEEVGKRVGKNLTDSFEKPKLPLGDLNRSISSLKLQIQSYQNIVDKSFDTKVITEYNRKIDQTAAEIQKLRALGKDALVPIENGAIRAKSGFNGLQNSVNQISRELPAFTFSAQTGFLAISNNIPILVDELGRLKTANKELVASGGQGKSIFGQLTGALFSWGTALSLGVTLLTVYGKEIGTFIMGLFGSKSAIDATKEAQRELATEMGKAGEATAKATLEVDLQKQAFEQSRKGVITKAEALKQYNEKLGKTLGFTDDLNVAEERTLKNGDAYIELMFKKAKAAALAALYQEQISEQAKIDAKSNEDAGSYITSGVKGKSPALNKLYEKNAQKNRDIEKAPFVAKAEAFKKLILETDNDIKEFSKNNGLSFDELTKPSGGKKGSSNIPKDTYESVLKDREKLADKINETIKNATGVTFTDEEKEVNAIKSRYASFRKEIEEQNEAIIKANKTNKNKVDLLPIGDIDGAEANDLKATADARRDKNFAEALKASETFEIQKQAIADKYAKMKGDILKLPSDEYVKRLAVLNDAEQKEVETVNAAAFKKSEIYKKLADDVVQYTRKGIQEEIKVVEGLLKSANLPENLQKELETQLEKLKGSLNIGIDQTNLEALNQQKETLIQAIADPLNQGTEEAKKYKKELAEIQAKINGIDSKGKFADLFSGGAEEIAGKAAQGLGELSGAFGKLSSSLEGTDDGLAYTVGSIGELLSVASDAAGAVASFASGDIVGGITKAISAVAGLFTIGKKVREMNAKARAEVQKFYDDAIKGEREYRALVRGRERDSAKAQADRLVSLQREHELLKAQGSTIQKDYDALMQKLQKEQSITGNEYTHGTWFRKAKTEYSYASLAGKDYDQLESLYTQGKLTEGAKDLFEQLKKLKEEGGDVAQALSDVAKQTAEIFTGTNVDALTDSILQMFKDGKTSAADFANYFEEVMGDAALSIFKDNVLKQSMQDFYKKFAEDAQSGGGLDKGEIESLQALFLKAGEDAKKQFEALQQVTGVKIGGADPTATSQNTIRGNVQNITANQADVLSGRIGSMVLSVAESNVIQRDGFKAVTATAMEQLASIKAQHATQMEISANTLRIADNTDRLKAIEEGITKMANNNAGRGAGII